jgi:hypothetical protein
MEKTTLTQEQRKFLIAELNVHRFNYGKSNLPIPDDVKRAQKIINKFNDRNDKHKTRLLVKHQKLQRAAREAIEFESPEKARKAVAAVKDFYAKTFGSDD